MNWIVCISTTAFYINIFEKSINLLCNSNTHICAGEHDDNMISLYEIDWRSRLIIEIYHSCFLPHWKLCLSEKLLLSSSWQQTYCKIIMSTPVTLSTCFDWVWISTTVWIFWYVLNHTDLKDAKWHPKQYHRWYWPATIRWIITI